MINPRNIPSTTGVYIFRKGTVPIYIGKSVNMKARVRSHIENAKVDIKESLIVKNATALDYHITDSELKAILLEAKLIQRYHPKYNVVWKDNKSYLYIKIAIREQYPKVLLVRKPSIAEFSGGSSKYFGPYSSVRTASMLLKEIRKIVPFCSQKNISNRPCFYSKIGLCNPCPNSIEYGQWNTRRKKQLMDLYKKNIRTIIRILKGNIKGVLEEYYRRLKILSKNKQYEEAIILRNKILRFEELLQRSSLDDRGYDYNRSGEALSTLLSFLQKYFPHLRSLRRIECYDISNLSQHTGTASMVVLKDGLIYKNEYRRFKIRNQKLRSDFEMLTEVLKRRFKQPWEHPSLIVVDGGKPQVKTVYKVLQSFGVDIPIVGLAKNPDRLVIGLKHTMPTVHLFSNNIGFTLLRLLRDESHRFAHKYHLFLRDRNFLL